MLFMVVLLQEVTAQTTAVVSSLTSSSQSSVKYSAQRPLAMTQDLAFFWQEAYPEVRKENRGRYAKHPWPEDPLTAEASGMTKKRMEGK